MIVEVETLIIGAGLIGSSVAMHLAQQGLKDIQVIDLDLEGSLSSSELNAGGVRATWVQPLNIELSKRSIEYFSQVAQEVGYRACGYLWLHNKDRWEAALRACETQLAHGWPVEVLDLDALAQKVPFIDKTEGIHGALFAPRDGLINPNLLKNHYRNRARSLGVVFDDRTLLKQVRWSEHHVQCFAERLESLLSDEIKAEILCQDPTSAQKRPFIEYRARRVINCAGAWAQSIAQILGYHTPSYPLRRQVCLFDCKELDLTPYGMIVDSSGVYFHPEATSVLSGFATPSEPPGMNFQYDGESFFQEFIWPALYERSTAFEKLRHVTGWAGLYEVSPDECAIVGPVHSNQPLASGRLFEAHSFSGHGVMQSYSVGLGLAEKIAFGEYQTLDLAPLSARRFETGEWIRENLII
ncbi:MAG: NAD(P)/FAD-dependent oxidoreductase [Bdellovibrionia bacterium]